jgi:LysM repeat protein
MEWKTDANVGEIEEEPYTTLKTQKSEKLIEKSEMPMILIGAGLFILIILFIVFIPKKDKVNVDDFKALVAQVSSLEQKIEAIERKNAVKILDYDPSENPEDPVDAGQMITWIKSNAMAIAGISQKLDAIGGQMPVSPAPSMGSTVPIPDASSETLTPVVTPPPAVQEAPVPKPEVAAKPKQTLQPKAVTQPKSSRTIQAKAKPPAAVSTPVSAAGKASHQVAKGETLYSIAKKYGVSVEKLQQLNGMKKGDVTIRSGQRLVVRP